MGIQKPSVIVSYVWENYFTIFLRFISGQIQSEKIGVIIRAFFALYPEPMTEMPSEKGQKYKSRFSFG